MKLADLAANTTNSILVCYYLHSICYYFSVGVVRYRTKAAELLLTLTLFKLEGVTRYRSVKCRKVAGSRPDEVIEFFKFI
jgi:hypothetical protein